MTVNDQLKMIVRVTPEEDLEGLVQVIQKCRKELRPWEGNIFDTSDDLDLEIEEITDDKDIIANNSDVLENTQGENGSLSKMNLSSK